MIFNIQRFSTHDGDGIRTLIFFKGCPLRCTWCSNPESQSFGYDLLFDQYKCISCLECANISQEGEFIFVGESDDTSLTPLKGGIRIQREKIKDPLVFKDICPAKAIVVAGEEKSIQEIIDEVEKDLPFYRNSGGGVTVSGGEPFAQSKFLYELLQELKKPGIHVSAETCLHVAGDKIKHNAEYIDIFLVDLKHTVPEKFREYTGGNIGLILSNLKNLEQLGANVIIRIPVIPGFNHTEVEMQSILDFAASLANVKEVHFIPYHALGKSKYTVLGREYNLPTSALDGNEVKKYMEYAENKGLKANLGG